VIGYLEGMVGLCWMTIVICVILFPITIPVLILFPCLMWGWPASRTIVTVPRSVWLPSALIVLLFAWAVPFLQTPIGPWNGFSWPAFVAIGIFATACTLGLRTWQRAARDRRVAGLLMLQLWFGAMATWVVAGAVSRGNGLGSI